MSKIPLASKGASTHVRPDRYPFQRQGIRLLPAAIDDLAFQAANSLIEGVESMLNGVVARINGFIEGSMPGWKRWARNARSRCWAILIWVRSKIASPGQPPKPERRRKTRLIGPLRITRSPCRTWG